MDPLVQLLAGGEPFQFQGDIRTRQATIVPATFDDDALTVDVVWSVGTRTLMKLRPWDDPFQEELDLNPASVRLARLNNGGAVLDSHGKDDHHGGMPGLDSQIGVVVNGSAAVDGKQGTAKIQFSRAEKWADKVQDVKDGVIQNLSARYKVHRYRDVTQPDDTDTVLLAIDWEPHELSLLPIPAEPGTGFRAATSDPHTCTIEPREENHAMTPEEKKRLIEEAAKAERARAAAIRADCLKAKLDTAFAEDLVERGVNLETARAAILDKVAGGEGATPAADPAPKPAKGEGKGDELDATAIAAEATKVERTRCAEIRKAVTSTKLEAGEEFATDLIEKGVPLDQARAAIIDKLATVDEKEGGHVGAVSVTREAGDAVLAGIENALSCRAGIDLHDKLDHDGVPIYQRGERLGVSEQGRPYRYMPLLRMAEELLELRGTRTRGLAKMELCDRALHSDSDFPQLVSNLQGRTLRQAYQYANRTFQAWARQTTAPDFKTITRIQIGEAPALEKILPGGEFKRGTMSDTAETYILSSFGKVIGFTRQLMINDDLDALTRLVQGYGVQAATLESDIVYLLLTTGADGVVMGDGLALFAAGHNNTGAGALAVAGLSTGRAVMRRQKGIDGVTLLNVNARVLLVPETLETEAQEVTTQINPEVSTNVNPFVSQFRAVVAEPRLGADSAAQWYMTADTGQIDTAEYCFLEGSSGPRIESRVTFNVDGMEVKAAHDFAAAMIDHRGMYRSTGV